MRIPDFKITDEKTKSALMGYLSLLTKDQSRAVTRQLAEVSEAVEKGDLVVARDKARTAVSSMIAIFKTIEEGVDMTVPAEVGQGKCDEGMSKAASSNKIMSIY